MTLEALLPPRPPPPPPPPPFSSPRRTIPPGLLLSCAIATTKTTTTHARSSGEPPHSRCFAILDPWSTWRCLLVKKWVDPPQPAMIGAPLAAGQWPVAISSVLLLERGLSRKMSSSRRMSGPGSMLADGRTPLRDSTTARPANLDNFGHYEGGKDCMGALQWNVHTHAFLSEQKIGRDLVRASKKTAHCAQIVAELSQALCARRGRVAGGRCDGCNPRLGRGGCSLFLGLWHFPERFCGRCLCRRQPPSGDGARDFPGEAPGSHCRQAHPGPK